MKKSKKLFLLISVVSIVALLTISVFAASAASSQAKAAAQATGMTAEEAVAIRTETDKTYGEIAREAGNYEEFKTISLQRKFAVIDSRVEEGQMTEEDAASLKVKFQEDCDGTGGVKLGQEYSVGFGKPNDSSQGNGNRNGSGNTNQKGSGSREANRIGNRSGICVVE